MTILQKTAEPELWLVRHGETEWSISGAHTSRTDIPLTDRGKERAREMSNYLTLQDFSLVLTSPRQRAKETCRLAGFGDVAQVDEDLSEWDYGTYEGRTTADIRATQPGWTVWNSPIPHGESLVQVMARAQRLLDQLSVASGKVLLFSHAHMLRILAACWCGFPPQAAQHFALGTGSLSTLGHEREVRVITSWNRSFEHEEGQ